MIQTASANYYYSTFHTKSFKNNSSNKKLLPKHSYHQVLVILILIKWILRWLVLNCWESKTWRGCSTAADEDDLRTFTRLNNNQGGFKMRRFMGRTWEIGKMSTLLLDKFWRLIYYSGNGLSCYQKATLSLIITLLLVLTPQSWM